MEYSLESEKKCSVNFLLLFGGSIALAAPTLIPEEKSWVAFEILPARFHKSTLRTTFGDIFDQNTPQVAPIANAGRGCGPQAVKLFRCF